MKAKFVAIRLSHRGGTFYCLDTETGKRISLFTKNKIEATKIVAAKNETLRNPALNLQLARVYLSAADAGVATRTWQHVMEAIVASKKAGSETRRRWAFAIKQKAFDPIRNRVILETQPGDLQAVLAAGTVSTNTHLRKIQNHAVGMGWLPWPVLPKKMFPPVSHKVKRAVTRAEHEAIIAREYNPERRAFYELCWHLGGSQTDVARLSAEDVDWNNRTVCYDRQKLQAKAGPGIRPPLIRFGSECAKVLQSLPVAGPLFPSLRMVKSKDRANEFRQRCQTVKITGVSLHCYRYSWAERAREAGYPERAAQEALGHNSKAVHRAYAKNATVTIPALEDFELLKIEGKRPGSDAGGTNYSRN